MGKRGESPENAIERHEAGVAAGDEATLELTVVAADGLKDTTFFPKSRHLATAWIDPRFKKSTKSLYRNPKLHFPISLEALQNPSSSLTIQVLSSRIPFRTEKLLGSATLPLSDLRIGGDVIAAALRRPSGRVAGTLRLSARVMWYLEVAPAACCVTGVPSVPGVLGEVEGSDFLQRLEPSAPPLPLIGSPILPMRPPDEMSGAPSGPPVNDGQRAWRSFLVGLVSGTVAAALVGVAGLSEG
ncbi:hypothetical protein J5N97_007830 [Dioscorea zingiberensis]|uniref:C2 domain-containing protein n=1 Tax=Dioscorea zingiberensis TaxID=325984 RepID=A0A9D5DD91_9LILI|nr:hypothetical protein J5N97_007830 [Dioscorea zingiberensis]